MSKELDSLEHNVKDALSLVERSAVYGGKVYQDDQMAVVRLLKSALQSVEELRKIQKT